jgi:hypothetical protein
MGLRIVVEDMWLKGLYRESKGAKLRFKKGGTAFFRGWADII